MPRSQQIMMAEHHPFGVSCGTRSIHEHADTVCVGAFDRRVWLGFGRAAFSPLRPFIQIQWAGFCGAFGLLHRLFDHILAVALHEDQRGV